jgi:undecaprenyl-diphosphatase
MELITKIIELDKQLLLLLNSFHNGFFDNFMFTFSKVGVWIPFYLSVVYLLFKSLGKKAIWLVLLLISGVVLADQLSGLMKDGFQRFRPSHDPAIQNFVHIVNNSRAGLYGFVSSHAANTVGFAMLSSLFIRRQTYTIAALSWAIITSYSRIYLGLHFPLDILGGAITGITIALFLYFIYKKYILKTQESNIVIDEKIPTAALLLSVAGIVVYSFLK